jgi:hypothetical protein
MKIMALAPPGYCYFSSPQRLRATPNLELYRLEVLVVAGQNVAVEPSIELKPHSPILMLLDDAEALLRYSGVGFIDDRQRPDTPEAEAIRCAKREEGKRQRAVMFHPAVFRQPAQIRWANDLLAHTEKSAWEINRILMGKRPMLLLKTAA